MLHNDGGNLLADGDDRVERCHRILENGCDSSAADTGPVLCIFKLCKVDNAGTVDAFFVLVKEPDAESDIIEYIGSCCVIVKVETVFHCAANNLYKVVNRLDAFCNIVSADGQINFFCDNLVARNFVCGNGLSTCLSVLSGKLSHFGLELCVVRSVVVHCLLMCGNGLFALIFKLLQFLVHFFDAVRKLLKAIFLLGRVNCELEVISLGSAESQILNAGIELFSLCLAEGGPADPVLLKLIDAAVDCGTVFIAGCCIQLCMNGLNARLNLGGVGNCCFGKFGIVENDGTVADIAVIIEHTCEGFREYGFTRSGFADDCDRFVFVNIQRDAADSCQNSAANAEFDFKILNG